MIHNDSPILKKSHLKRVAKRAVAPGLIDPDATSTTPAAAAKPTTTTSAPVTSKTSAAPDTTTPVVNRPPITNPPEATSITSSTTSPSSTVTSTSTSSTSVTSTTSANTSSTSGTTSSSIPSSVVTPKSSTTSNIATINRTVAGSGTVPSSTSTAIVSPTTTAASNSGVSTAGIIGIAAAGVVGVAVVAGIVMFLLRRWSRRGDDDFDAADFRRQSVVLQDDDAGGYGYGSRGPRPPTMIERHRQAFANPPPQHNSFQTGYGYGAPNPNYGDFSTPSPASFTPGQIVPGQYGNAAPFFNPGFQPGMPVNNQAYDMQGAAITRAASTGAATMLSRGPSNGAATMLTRGNSVARGEQADAEYADLTRASVTPYQAAQYAAISKQLNIPPPVPLPNVSGGAERVQAGHMPNPFEDTNTGGHNTPESQSMAPPASLARVASPPPSLPELRMNSHVFSSADFPVTPSPCNASFDLQRASGGVDEALTRPPAVAQPSPLGRASPKLSDRMPPLSPVLSSPQRAQFVNASDSKKHDGRETPVEIGFVRDSSPGTPAPAYHEFGSTTDVPVPEKAHVAGAPTNSQTKRPETVYDDEDAYGGF